MKGSLHDLGIAELLQFPAGPRKTGRLRIESGGEQAELYFAEGALCHARLGGVTGFPVLVEILPWQEGSFEFEFGVEAPERSIAMDVGLALLAATEESDARASGQAVDGGPDVRATAGFSTVFGPGWEPAVFARLSTFIAEHPLFFFACVMDRRGQVKAEYCKPPDALEGNAETYFLLRDMMKQYAHACRQRTVVDGSYCQVASRAYGTDRVLVTMARPGASADELGAAIDGLALKLEDPFVL